MRPMLPEEIIFSEYELHELHKKEVSGEAVRAVQEEISSTFQVAENGEMPDARRRLWVLLKQNLLESRFGIEAEGPMTVRLAFEWADESRRDADKD